MGIHSKASRSFVILTALFLLSVPTIAREIRIQGMPVREDKLELVVQNQRPLTAHVAERLQFYLGKVTGQEIRIVEAPSGNGLSLVLGDCELLRNAGVGNVDELPREGYFIIRKGSLIFLAGRDSDTATPLNGGWNQHYKRGTLNAAMDFLERFADMRFFFPGEMGTIIPTGKGVMIPPEIHIVEEPDYSFRRIYSGRSKWWQESIVEGMNNCSVQQVALRMGTFSIPYTHGLAHVNFMERFNETHPEYFALKPDGKRYNNPAERHSGQLCFNSGIVKEIYQDAKAYFQGKPSSERGIQSWYRVAAENYYCIMPQDALYWCSCEKCAKLGPVGMSYFKDSEASARINHFLWQMTADIANRLTREGIDGIVTQMPYGVMKPLPDVELPSNISIQLAVKGIDKPELWEEDKALIRQWHDKVNRPISVWTYPGKHMGKAAMKGIPSTMFHNMGKYLQYMRPYLCGAFIEDETDFELFNHLDYYIYSKVAWNLDLSVEELLADYYSQMYGSAAPLMESFFNEMETLWCTKIIGNIIETAEGPVAKLPTDFEVWQNIYSSERRKAWSALFDKALAKTAAEPEAQKRIAFMKKEYLGRILSAGETFDGRKGLVDAWKVEVPGSVWLRPQVTINRENGFFSFTYQCEEPKMNEIKALQTDRDAKLTYDDSCVELLINPSGDRKNYYHFIANINGVLYDAACKVNEHSRLDWNCEGAAVTASKQEDGFTITIVIPEASIAPFNPDGFPVNFARHRSLESFNHKEIYYQWSPVGGRSFHDIERFGLLCLKPQPNSNLLKDPDFVLYTHNTWKPGGWNFTKNKNSSGEGQKYELDKRVFLFGGQSAHVINQTGQSFIVSQKFSGMEPNKKYRVSYYLRMQDVEPGKFGVGGWLAIGEHQQALPRTRMTGTAPWHPQSFVITAPADTTPETPCSFAVWNWSHKGEHWVDHVEIIPLEE